MSFAKLIGLIGDNEEAMELAKGLESTMKGLTDKVNDLELKNSDIQESRDKVKSQLRLVRESFGIEEITKDAIESIKKIKPDEKSATEIKNLQDQLSKAVESKKELEEGYKAKLNNLVMKTELNKTGLAQKALDADTYSILETLVLNGASYTDDGNIVYKNSDGSTMFVDGKPMGLSDKVNELLAKESYSGLFKPTGVGGGGKPPSFNIGAQDSLNRMSATEMMKRGRE